jgi:hypothetical protein
MVAKDAKMTHKLGYLFKRFSKRSGGLILLVFISSSTLVFSSIRLRAQSAAALPTVPIAGPLTVSTNPHYFKDGNGTAFILNGSQTWNTFQDYGTDGSLQTLDFNAFVKFLAQHGNNFTLLWTVEMPKFCNLPVTASAPPEFTVSPIQWERTGPGTATDGGLKFDLTKFNQSFFDRMRERTKALNDAGIYAGIYLFTGEYLNKYRCSTDGYPLTGANNINGIDDGYTSGPKGIGAINMTAPNTITKVQDAYVEKMIDTLNDLPNVLWIVSEEGPSDSVWWNNLQIAHIRAYEAGKPHQHPIGYGAPLGITDTTVYNSDADWVAPYVLVSPAATCGTGKPTCKVNVNDSDHSYYRWLWHETPQQNRAWAWENFTTGNQTLFMDPYLVYYPRENRNLCVSPIKGVCTGPDSRYDNLRDNLGYIVRYSRKLNLTNMAPRDRLSSTGFCLAQTPPAGAEYLVYTPSGGTFTVDLSAMAASRTLAVEWFNPSTGAVTTANPISSGSSAQAFTPPFSGDAVLYLVDTKGHATSR